jgi:hypothetical protein
MGSFPTLENMPQERMKAERRSCGSQRDDVYGSVRQEWWAPIDAAPFDEDVLLEVTNGRAEPYNLPSPCRLTTSGWISSTKGTPLAVTPVKWRSYNAPPRSRPIR